MWLWQKDTPDQTNVLLLPRVKSSPSEIQVINIIVLDLTKINNVHLSFYVGKKATLPFCFSGPSLRSRLGDIHLNSQWDNCAVSGWMTMAPCARGPGWADCGGADGGGRLQRPELVLCDFSARCTRERGGSAPNRTTISTDHWTAGKAQKMSNGADSAAKHKLPPASESTPQFEVMECDLRALTTMDLQLCHRISVTLMTKPDPCLWSTCPSIFFIVGDVAFLFQAQLNYD